MKHDPPLRIAQISPLWTRVPPATYGGVELLMKLLIDELVERGHEVTLFATADCVTTATLHPVCELNLCAMLESGAAYVYEYYANGVMADVLQRQAEFDVIHSHLAPVVAAARRARHHAGALDVAHEHSSRRRVGARALSRRPRGGDQRAPDPRRCR